MLCPNCKTEIRQPPPVRCFMAIALLGLALAACAGMVMASMTIRPDTQQQAAVSPIQETQPSQPEPVKPADLAGKYVLQSVPTNHWILYPDGTFVGTGELGPSGEQGAANGTYKTDGNTVYLNFPIGISLVMEVSAGRLCDVGKRTEERERAKLDAEALKAGMKKRPLHLKALPFANVETDVGSPTEDPKVYTYVRVADAK